MLIAFGTVLCKLDPAGNSLSFIILLPPMLAAGQYQHKSGAAAAAKRGNANDTLRKLERSRWNWLAHSSERQTSG
jgi:hypothetical protein